MRNRYFLLSLVAPMLVSLMFTGVSGAQTARFKGLHTFGGGSDGRNPGSPLVFDAAGNLYGTTGEGGTGACSGGCGTVFELVPSGSNWKDRILYNFPGPSGSSVIRPL